MAGEYDSLQLLLQLLDQLDQIGQTAHQLKEALGSNGHKAEAPEVKRYLKHQANK